MGVRARIGASMGSEPGEVGSMHWVAALSRVASLHRCAQRWPYLRTENSPFRRGEVVPRIR